MVKPKLLYTAAVLLGLGAVATPAPAYAAKFNALIANPFVFCAAPKPCKICQPWRRIWQEICAEQKHAGSGMREPVPRASPIIETVDEEGQKSYLRIVDGWTIRSARRSDVEDASLNADQPGDGVQVIDAPVAEMYLDPGQGAIQ